jgi:hypothetical protein
MDYDTLALTLAINSWRKGRPITMTLYSRLMEDGYDVPRLERAYWNRR